MYEIDEDFIHYRILLGNLYNTAVMYKLPTFHTLPLTGTTEPFKTGEIVKQGTVIGPDMCCAGAEKVNFVGEQSIMRVGNVDIGILGYIDDILGIGDSNQARKTIRCLRELEIRKKYTFGMEKTKWMVIPAGKEEIEEILEKIGQGTVERTDLYKYLGLLINEGGNLLSHIENKRKECQSELVAIMTIASQYNLGPMHLTVTLFLFEICIITSILYHLEAWAGMTKEELEKLESLQKDLLCQICQLPKSTSYLGLLHETGMWSMEMRLSYRRLLLYHNIMKSDDKRLVKKIVKQQREEEDFFYSEVKNTADSLEIDLDRMVESDKETVKVLIRRKIKKEMEKKIEGAITTTNKLRFI